MSWERRHGDPGESIWERYWAADTEAGFWSLAVRLHPSPATGGVIELLAKRAGHVPAILCKHKRHFGPGMGTLAEAVDWAWAWCELHGAPARPEGWAD